MEEHQLYSRNWLFVDQALQRKLATARILIAGVGMGSVAAILAARTGFKQFTLADGDVVEISNLNRQHFFAADIGRNKARVTAEYLASLNPDIRTRVVEKYLQGQLLLETIRDSDYIVNTIDWESEAFLDCCRICRECGKTMIFPFNVGWGSAVYVFSSRSVSVDEMLDTEKQQGMMPVDIKHRFVQHALANGANPEYLKLAAEQYWNPSMAPPPYDPQLGGAVSLSASVIAAVLVQLVSGTFDRFAPQVIRLDPFQ